jgi:hypothetical protein
MPRENTARVSSNSILLTLSKHFSGIGREEPFSPMARESFAPDLSKSNIFVREKAERSRPNTVTL